MPSQARMVNLVLSRRWPREGWLGEGTRFFTRPLQVQIAVTAFARSILTDPNSPASPRLMDAASMCKPVARRLCDGRGTAFPRGADTATPRKTAKTARGDAATSIAHARVACSSTRKPC